MTLFCSPEVLDDTIDALKIGSRSSVESVALWLGASTNRSRVLRTFVPEHTSRADQFQFTPRGMADLRHVLKQERLFVAAQLHTHPFEAFHSKADDMWAIVRHVGALSIVLPRFARNTTADNFLSETAVFEMVPSGAWVQVREPELADRLKLR